MQMNLFTRKNKLTDIENKPNLGLGEREEGFWNLGLTLLPYKIDKHKDLLYSTRNYS